MITWKYYTEKDAHSIGFESENGVLIGTEPGTMVIRQAILSWDKDEYSVVYWHLELHQDGEMIAGPFIFNSRQDAIFVADAYVSEGAI